MKLWILIFHQAYTEMPSLIHHLDSKSSFHLVNQLQLQIYKSFPMGIFLHSYENSKLGVRRIKKQVKVVERP